MKVGQKSEKVIVDGSETLYPLLKKIIDAYVSEKENLYFDIKSHGTNVGIQMLQSGKIDMAMASRAMNDNEVKYFINSRKKIIEKVIAYDALAIIVNKSNPIEFLSLEQLSKIYSGEITNWADLGGENMEIKVISRNAKSGTYDFFNKLILKGRSPDAKLLVEKENDKIIPAVESDPAAIAYIGLGYLNNQVKAVKISCDKGCTYIEPTQRNVQTQIYPIIRPLYLYYLEETQPKIESFIKYILSETGQRIVLQSNYIPLKNYKKVGIHLSPI
ncbi:MAG: phosphate ABC transporter substrate-binding protein [Cytophagaceae bacterium]|nr:phosphate ABC transporter substrate-binding protein [Cytophagaceae bacterium]MDW8455550.1 phosphate ABC transporter substrate-binding protein [Cytophagaceae bacterium]